MASLDGKIVLASLRYFPAQNLAFRTVVRRLCIQAELKVGCVRENKKKVMQTKNSKKQKIEQAESKERARAKRIKAGVGIGRSNGACGSWRRRGIRSLSRRRIGSVSESQLV